MASQHSAGRLVIRALKEPVTPQTSTVPSVASGDESCGTAGETRRGEETFQTTVRGFTTSRIR